MYSWIWRTLPGRLPLKLLGALLLVAALLLLLFFVVFPWVEPHVGLNDVTVNN